MIKIKKGQIWQRKDDPSRQIMIRCKGANSSWKTVNLFGKKNHHVAEADLRKFWQLVED